MRALRALVLVGALVGAAVASAAVSPPPLQHPSPLFSNLSLDYTSAIPSPGGGFAMLEAPGAEALPASHRDIDFLRYRTRDDWGGFLPAPVGELAFETGGIVILGSPQKPGLPLLERQPGDVSSYGLRHGVPAPSPAPLPPSEPQPPLPSPTPVPPANGGFGGDTNPHHGAGGSSHSGGAGSGATGNAGNCGTKGLSIVSDLRHCRIHVVDQGPGAATFEHLTITNTSSSTYTLSFEAQGQEDALWNDLELGVWQRDKPAPTTLPPLRYWATQFTPLITLAPGQRVRYTIEMYLPPSAGNGDQKLAAVVDFAWRATA
ncbi:MAG TPA: hypothetical protein VLW49_11955 [Gaiellaceae bacterium]|nr:hypothetical protein [Gaiellaceae bacterium]